MLVRLLAILILAFGLHVSVAKADECIPVDEFSRALASEGVALRGSTAAATDKLEKFFNENRAAQGQPAREISIFLFGLVKVNSGEIGVLVSIADANGCIVPSATGILSVRYWVTYMTSAGVSVDDFIPLDGA